MDKLDRKNFIKKACATTACMCGFGSIVFSNNNNRPEPDIQEIDPRLQLVQNWISSLLENLQSGFDEKNLKPIIKQSSVIHYSNLKMDEMLTEYVGDLEKFIVFIEEKWGWKVQYDKELKIIVADENKNTCVCPILDAKSTGTTAICYCSEGFAESMFSKVLGIPVNAKVISSVRRGDKSCKYEMRF